MVLFLIFFMTSYLPLQAGDGLPYSMMDLWEFDAKNDSTLSSNIAAQVQVLDNDKDGALINAVPLKGAGRCLGPVLNARPKLSRCTGTLIHPRILMTNAHCVTGADEFSDPCSQLKWAVHLNQGKWKNGKWLLPSKHIFSCSKILKLDKRSEKATDLALIALDRPVKIKTPLKFFMQRPKKGQRLLIPSTPWGLMPKISNGVVLETKNELNYWGLTFYGSSGAPILDKKTHRILGLVSKRSNGPFTEKLDKASDCHGHDETWEGPEKIGAWYGPKDISTLPAYSAATFDVKKLSYVIKFFEINSLTPLAHTIQADMRIMVQKGKLEELKGLEKSGVRLNFTRGRTLLNEAIFYRRKKIFTYLTSLQSFRDFSIINLDDLSGNTPLHTATFANRPWFVNKLLKLGANTHVANFKGERPIDIARKYHVHESIGKALEKAMK